MPGIAAALAHDGEELAQPLSGGRGVSLLVSHESGSSSDSNAPRKHEQADGGGPRVQLGLRSPRPPPPPAPPYVGVGYAYATYAPQYATLRLSFWRMVLSLSGKLQERTAPMVLPWWLGGRASGSGVGIKTMRQSHTKPHTCTRALCIMHLGGRVAAVGAKSRAQRDYLGYFGNGFV
jgi:hypothetical protein